MNIPPLPLSRVFITAIMTIVCLLALPMNAHAKAPKGIQHGNGKESKDKHYKQNDRDGHDRQVYASHPRSGFVLTFGTGYAGQGYYHGYIDGQIGPQSRRAIAGYQRDQGLRPTGIIDSGLLYSLGLR